MRELEFGSKVCNQIMQCSYCTQIFSTMTMSEGCNIAKDADLVYMAICWNVTF